MLPLSQVTALFRPVVAPGKEADFEKWVFRLSAFCQDNYPGHLGTEVLCPRSGSAMYAVNPVYSPMHRGWRAIAAYS